MSDAWREHLVVGYERMCAWADLLDRINVVPVADGDTGRNLRLSLAPLRQRSLVGQAVADRSRAINAVREEVASALGATAMDLRQDAEAFYYAPVSAADFDEIESIFARLARE